MRPSRLVGSLIVVAGALSAVACNEPASPTRAVPSAVVTRPSNIIVQSLIACPTTDELSSSVTVDTSGGTFTLGPAEVVLPAGAVLGPTELHISVPAGDFMKVEVTAKGFDHFEFESPISISLDYSRCDAAAVSTTSPLSVWYVGDDGTMLEQMPTLDDRANKRVTFLTPHLSGYAIAD